MPSEKNHQLDRQLAELRGALQTVETPVQVQANLEIVLAQKIKRKARPRPIDNQWWIAAGLAAMLLLAVLPVIWPEPPAEPVFTSGVVAPTEYFMVPTLVPVLVHSVANGTEIHYMDAQLITDQRGTAQAVYLTQSQ